MLEDLDTSDEHYKTKWGYTQNGLGRARMNLGKNDVDPTRLTNALAAFDHALEVLTPDDGIQWAVTQLNRGLTPTGPTLIVEQVWLKFD